jgi:hypothetical protein
MSSIRPLDRASLCSFTFADGRRCRTPLSSRHPRLCFDHARKEGQSHPADPLDIDLSIFFSGDCVSTHDLSEAISRLLPDVTDSQIKRKTASTISSLSRSLVQTIQLAQHEFIRAASETLLPRPGRRPKTHAKRAHH